MYRAYRYKSTKSGNKSKPSYTILGEFKYRRTIWTCISGGWNHTTKCTYNLDIGHLKDYTLLTSVDTLDELKQRYPEYFI